MFLSRNLFIKLANILVYYVYILVIKSTNIFVKTT